MTGHAMCMQVKEHILVEEIQHNHLPLYEGRLNRLHGLFCRPEDQDRCFPPFCPHSLTVCVGPKLTPARTAGPQSP